MRGGSLYIIGRWVCGEDFEIWMMRRKHTLNTLMGGVSMLEINEIKEKVTPVAKTFGIKSVSLFGSYAKGEATEESDVDIYIEKGKLKSLIQYFSFVSELENILKCHVDVVTTGIEDREFLLSIQKEGILLYEE